jgi:hypothetical protein
MPEFSRTLSVNPVEAEHLASDLIELITRQNFAYFLTGGEVLRGWARSASGNTVEGLARIVGGIEDWMATGAMLAMPCRLKIRRRL